MLCIVVPNISKSRSRKLKAFTSPLCGLHNVCSAVFAVNVIPDKPNYTTPQYVQPGGSSVLAATAYLSSLGGPKHAHEV